MAVVKYLTTSENGTTKSPNSQCNTHKICTLAPFRLSPQTLVSRHKCPLTTPALGLSGYN